MSPQFVISLITIVLIVHVMLLATSYLIMLERKTCAWIQDRIGPNRTGFSFGVLPLKFHFWGLGQPLADGIKMFLKEDYTPPFVERALFLLAPVLVIVPALIGWAVIPWGGYYASEGFTWWAWLPFLGGQTVAPFTVAVTGAPLSIGVIYMLAIGSLAVYGVVVGGYGSANKYAFLGGLRATAQMLSYEIPQGLSVLIIILMMGTATTDVIAVQQSLGDWNIWYQPLLAFIFFTCILAECNRAPFDIAEAEQELVAGYHVEYSSMKFALFFLGEYLHMITGSAFFVLLFLGGWSANPIPGVADLPIVGGLGIVLLKFAIFAGKVTFLVFAMMWIRWTLPRLRFDQLMKLAWRAMIPIALVLLLATGVVIYLDASFWILTAVNAIVFIGAAYLYPKLPSDDGNRRVPLAGSRFSPLLPADGN